MYWKAVYWERTYYDFDLEALFFCDETVNRGSMKFEYR